MTVWFILLVWFGLSAFAAPFISQLFKPRPPRLLHVIQGGRSHVRRLDWDCSRVMEADDVA